MAQNANPDVSRRRFLRSTAASAASVLTAKKSSAASQRPNILWLSCEDTSPDLGCYGDTYARTPNLDRFAAQGARFTNGFTIAGVCAPSRSGIITGMYPSSIGTMHMRSKRVPPPYVKCFPEYLRAAGYYCTNNAKTDYNFDSPLTAWDESSKRAHWRNRPKGQPFFSVINIETTHESKIRATPEEFAHLTRNLKPQDRHDPAQAKLPPYYPDTPLVRRDWANYYDLVTAMDLQMAGILRDLEADGLSGNTVVFFWGDHGRGLPRAKRWIYDSGIHAPLLVRWPGRIKPGAVEDRLVSFIDLAPTVLSIAGVKPPDYMQGRAFLGDYAAPPRPYIYAARDRMDETYDIIRCVRDKRYKYIRNFQPEKTYAQAIAYMDLMPTMAEMRRLNAEGKLNGPEKLFFRSQKPIEELYDTASDPHEVHNLADSPQHKDTLLRMRRQLERWQTETRDLGLIPEPELKERMRPGGTWQVTASPVVSPSGGNFTGLAKVRLSCPTDGSSIAYTTESGDSARWKLYSQEFTIENSTVLRARACRLGYKDSPEASAEFRIS